MTYFEDLSVGEERTFGTYEVTREEIVDFAEQYDPQPMHVDEDAAAESMFGEIVASGWHVAAMSMRLLVENFLADSGALGSPGVDELRWPNPVRPGDELAVTTEVLEKRPSESRSDRGIVRVDVRTHDQDDELVMTMEAIVFWARRQ